MVSGVSPCVWKGSVTVQYAPTAYGSHDSGTLAVSGEKSSVTAALSGAGTGKSQYDCTSYGGFFLPDTPPRLWTCYSWNNSGADDYFTKFYTLGNDCAADGGNFSGSGFIVPGSNTFTCFRF